MTIFRINKINVCSVVCCHIARHNEDTFSGISPPDAVIIFLPQQYCPVIRCTHGRRTIYHKPYSSVKCSNEPPEDRVNRQCAARRSGFRTTLILVIVELSSTYLIPCRYMQRKLKCLFIGFLWTFSMQAGKMPYTDTALSSNRSPTRFDRLGNPPP